MRIAVAGGTGAVGDPLVSLLRARGHQVSVLARATGVDLVTGAGLDAALAGSAAVVDVSNVQTAGARRSIAFFAATTTALLQAGVRAGVGHHVALSIVGIDRVALGYYAGKRRQEALLEAATLPWTVLRATQLHEFPGQLLDRSPGPVAVLPRMRIAPIAASEVAAALADLVPGPARGRVEDLAGPAVHELSDLARRVLRARGSRRVVLAVPVGGRAMRTGGLLPDGGGPRGTIGFDAWLAGT
jgi:uncharacterized protein YbjT (DUF2867 family)